MRAQSLAVSTCIEWDVNTFVRAACALSANLNSVKPWPLLEAGIFFYVIGLEGEGAGEERPLDQSENGVKSIL